MPITQTNTNHVVTYETDRDDAFVQVMWLGPSELHGGTAKQFFGPLLPIEDHQTAVDWAVAMADQMRFPLHVVPLRRAEALASEEMRRAAARLTQTERGELRAVMIATLAAVMRDCDDAAVRAEAYEVLVDMGLVRP
jgi:hypothetical protein